MKELLEKIAKALVDNPDRVQVRAVEGEETTVLELRVHLSDLGSDRPQGANGQFHPHHSGRGGREAAKTRHDGNLE